VLYPEQCRLVNPLGCWNWHDANHQSADHGEPSLIAGMTRQVIAEYDIDPTRVYVAGMSAGGAMAVILGQEYPNLYAAVGVHSGVPSGVASDLLSALTAMSMGPTLAELPPVRTRKSNPRAVPTIVFHGDQDAVVHPANGKAVHTRLDGDPIAPRSHKR
jgi:poly(hydroxyalkanoate) depolymerase family esterase